MNFKKGIRCESFLSLAALILALFSSACGGGSSQPGTSPETQSRSILVVLSPLSSSVVPGGTAAVSAAVSNDSAHAGVVWELHSGKRLRIVSIAKYPVGGAIDLTSMTVVQFSESGRAPRFRLCYDPSFVGR